MEEIQVLSLAPDEWQLYKQIRLEALQLEPEAFSSKYIDYLNRPESYWQERLVEAQAATKSWLLFAKLNDQIVGMIGAYCPDGGNAVNIISVYVTKEKRGRGIAIALMTAILAEITRINLFRKAVLEVNAGQAAAISLYQRFGFQITSEKNGVMGDGIMTRGYVMEKELSQHH